MDKHYFLNAGIPPPLHFEPSMSNSPIPTWKSLSSDQSNDYFLNPIYDKSIDQYTPFESAMSSMVSSPAASNSVLSNDSFAIRELIGKLGTICNSGDIPPPLPAATTTYIGGGNNTNTSCYTTPLNSPPKLHNPIMDQFVKKNLPNLGNPMPMNPTLPALSAADPGFAERAAKFSCFGSRSFNGRINQFGLNKTEIPYILSTPLMGNGNLHRVSSSPSLKAAGSPMENKYSAQTQMEMRSKNCSVSGSDKKFSKLSGSSNEESCVSGQIPSGEFGSRTPIELNSRKRKAASKGKAKEDATFQSVNVTKVPETDDVSNTKRFKPADCNRNENYYALKTEDKKQGTTEKDAGDEDDKEAKTKNTKPPEPLRDYIHVRARRGQATDSHSLAERVRREKIGERMKLLQDLVPGCNKVTGKALMLDEIINYVESLQRQVEFLSMKLATVNPRLDFNMDSLLSKDILQPNCSLQQPTYALDYSLAPAASYGAQFPPVDGFGGVLPQFSMFCEDDLQSIVQMGFGQNPHQDTDFHSQSFSVPNQTSNTKIEL